MYYINQPVRGGGLTYSGGIGPVYSSQLYLERGHGIDNLFGRLFRWIQTFLWLEAKDVGRETLRTGGKILIDIAENKSPEISPKCIVSKHINNSVQNLIGNVRGMGRKSVRISVTSVKKNAKVALVIKRGISKFTSFTLHVRY